MPRANDKREREDAASWREAVRRETWRLNLIEAIKFVEWETRGLNLNPIQQLEWLKRELVARQLLPSPPAKLHSAGGKARADRHHRKHSAWQKQALAIWARKPWLSERAVARMIKTRPPLSPKHIARYLRKP
jgi:hypothetical protein